METRLPWWGHNKEHGWVVLDRDIPCNTPGLRGELMFFRCRDEQIYFLKRELWDTPGYQYAPNYARSLPGEAADEARLQYEALLKRWPEFRAELQRQHQEILDREEAQRVAEEKLQKAAAAAARKKQRAAGAELKIAAAAEAATAEATSAGEETAGDETAGEDAAAEERR